MGVLDEKKGDAFDAFKSFHAFVTTQKGTKLKCLKQIMGVSLHLQNLCPFVTYMVLKESLQLHITLRQMGWQKGIIGHCVSEYDACCP